MGDAWFLYRASFFHQKVHGISRQISLTFLAKMARDYPLHISPFIPRSHGDDLNDLPRRSTYRQGVVHAPAGEPAAGYRLPAALDVDQLL